MNTHFSLKKKKNAKNVDILTNALNGRHLKQQREDTIILLIKKQLKNILNHTQIHKYN